MESPSLSRMKLVNYVTSSQCTSILRYRLALRILRPVTSDSTLLSHLLKQRTKRHTKPFVPTATLPLEDLISRQKVQTQHLRKEALIEPMVP